MITDGYRVDRLILLIVGFSLFTFGFGLAWGQLLPFHPDENNIIMAVNRIHWPTELNPHFFAYGGLTIYLSSLLNQLFEINPRLVLRLISVLASLAGLWLVYNWLSLLSVFNRRLRLFGLLLTSLSVGIIQQSHFGTVDNLGAVATLAGFYFLAKHIKTSRLSQFWFGWLSLSLAASLKISFGLWLAVAGFVFVAGSLAKKKFKQLLLLPFFGLTAIGLFLITNPYALIDYPSFLGSIRYESQVAFGQMLVFYTRQFLDVNQVKFIINQVLVWNLNPVVLVLALIGLIVSIRTKTKVSFLFLAVVLINLVQPSIWFVLWTRFFVLWFYLGVISAGLALSKIHTAFWPAIFFISLAWAVGFLQATYWQTDSRLVMSHKISRHIGQSQTLLQEEGNVVNLPVGSSLAPGTKMLTFDPYQLEESKNLQRLSRQLEVSDYLLIGSRRGWLNHIRLANQYPKTAKFYQDLFAGRSGWRLIDQVYYPFKVFGLDLNDEIYAEETFTVFDHPHLILFKKM